MSFGQRLAFTLVLAIVGLTGLSLKTHAGQFSLKAYTPESVMIAATDIKVRTVYTNSSGGTTDTTTTSGTNPIPVPTPNLDPTHPGVTFTITRVSTSQSVTFVLHGNIPVPSPMPVHAIIPGAGTAAAPSQTPKSESGTRSASYPAIPSYPPVQWVGYSFCR